jgi:hemolysin D
MSNLDIDSTERQKLYQVDHSQINKQLDPTTPAIVTANQDSEIWSDGTQEQLDGLPRVWTRGLLYFLVIFTVILLPWSMFSQVDETGQARGRLEPKGATIRLDAPIAGTVAAVHVKEGQQVRQGQILLELESDLLRADLQQSIMKLEGQQNRLVQLQQSRNQLLTAVTTQQQQNQAQATEKIAQLDQAQQALSANKTTTPFLASEKLAQVNQAKQALNSAKTNMILADSKFQKDVTEVERYRQLWQQGGIPEVKLVEVQRIAAESQKLRSQAQADVNLAKERLQEQEQSYQKLVQQSRADRKQVELKLQEQRGNQKSLQRSGELALLKSREQLKDLDRQIASLKTEATQNQGQIESLRAQIEQRTLRSPANGTIFQFPTAKAKVFLQPGALVAQIAPQGSTLILKAQVPSQNSGFLQLGMPVKVKFDAYPFQDYGVVAGRLLWKSPDSKKVDSGQTQVEVFDLEIALEQTAIQSQNKRIELTPGQTATAEVVIRQRRIIDFIIDPFTQLQKGGLKL